MLFKYRLMTRNCLAPDIMFSQTELDSIKDFLKRKDKSRAPELERIRVKKLLDRARIHGFEPDGINVFDEIHWIGIGENPEGSYKKTSYDPRGVGTVASVMVCEECAVEFRAEHYENDFPNRYCPKCAWKREAAKKADIEQARKNIEKIGNELPF